jgi:uncharacterized BrkB/YihY/UPF0761 family membrane protein
MRTAGRFLISCFGAVVCFVLGLLITVRINLTVYGNEEFGHNAGAKFAVLIEALIVSSILSMIGFFVVFRLLRRKYPDATASTTKTLEAGAQLKAK